MGFVFEARISPIVVVLPGSQYDSPMDPTAWTVIGSAVVILIAIATSFRSLRAQGDQLREQMTLLREPWPISRVCYPLAADRLTGQVQALQKLLDVTPYLVAVAAASFGLKQK